MTYAFPYTKNQDKGIAKIIEVGECNMQHELGNVSEITQVERPVLIQFFEKYISLLVKKEKYEAYSSEERQTIRQRKAKTLRSIERDYEKAYDSYFEEDVRKHRRQMRKVEQWLFRERRFVFLRIWMLVWLYYFLFNETLGSTGHFWTAFFVAIPIYMFRGLIKKLFQFLFNMFKKVYFIMIEKRSIRQAAAQGVTKENLKEVGGFALSLQKAAEEFQAAEQKFNGEMRSILREIKGEIEPYAEYLPPVRSFSNIPQLMIMYNAVLIGRADTWKECLEVLSIEVKHQEIVQNMQHLKRLGNDLIRESQVVSSKLSEVNREIRQASNTLQSELRQVEHAVKYENYATVDVYHHKSK